MCSSDLIDWLRTRPLALRQGDFLMVHAGLLPEWEFEQARDLAHEVEKVLSGPHWQDFLSVMYGNTPDLVPPSSVRKTSVYPISKHKSDVYHCKRMVRLLGYLTNRFP